MSPRDMLLARVAAYQANIKLYDTSASKKCDHCGSNGWSIGRSTAECGNCGNALPLAREFYANSEEAVVRHA